MAEKNALDDKKFYELNNQVGFDALAGFVGERNRSLADVARYSSREKGFNREAVEYAAQLTQQGYGNVMGSDFIKSVRDNPAFVGANPNIGKAYSYSDLARQALATNPDFDPNDTGMVNSLAEQIQKRGFTNKNAEDIRTLAVNQNIKSQIERATNPGKFLSEEQKTGNLSTADRLLKQTYGPEFADPDLADFIAERLAEGESAFEVSQFLQTTPQYAKQQSDIENKRAQEEARGARESLGAELLKGEEEAFSRATPNIISSYMRAGRLGSSGLQSALAKARADLERERQGFLATAGFEDAARVQGYRREDFVGNQANAYNQYLRQNQPAYQQRFALQDTGNQARFQQPYQDLNRYYGLQDQARTRQYEIEDYNRMKNDYFNYLNSQKGNSGLGVLSGAFGGAAAGAPLGGAGILAGALLGGYGGYSAYK